MRNDPRVAPWARRFVDYEEPPIEATVDDGGRVITDLARERAEAQWQVLRRSGRRLAMSVVGLILVSIGSSVLPALPVSLPLLALGFYLLVSSVRR